MVDLIAPDTSIVTTRGPAPGVRFERRGASAVITLDRSAKYNAIDSGMKAAIASEIPIIARDPQVYGVVWRAAPGRMFSAGGDVREYFDLVLGNPEKVATECAREYSLIWLIDCFSKPTVALIDGAVMGTGVGMTQVLTHRVAGAGYRYQMPETAIGFFPDNGVAWHLARLPGEIGVFLGLTGTPLERADAYRLGLVSHCIDADHFDDIAGQIAEAEPIDPILDGLHVDPGPAQIDAYMEVIQRCFSAPTVAGIRDRLAKEKEQRDWCVTTAERLAARSPLALEVTLEHIRRARHLDLRQTLTVDHRLAVRLVVSHDFAEGVRVRLIDRRGEPRWRPATLGEVSPAKVARFFDPLPGGELVLPTRQEMQAARV